MPKIFIKEGNEKGQVFPIEEGETSIGRDPFNSIVLSDRRVSRSHARIISENGTFFIEDLDSVNGTMVNNQPVTRQRLEKNDEIKIGMTVLILLPSEASEEVKDKKSDTRIVKKAKSSENFSVELILAQRDGTVVEKDVEKLDAQTLKQSYRKLTILYSVSMDLGQIYELPKLLEITLERVINIMNADRGYIVLVDEESGELIPQIVHKSKDVNDDEEITISTTISKQVLESGEALLLSDARQDDRFKEAQSIIHHAIRSTLCVPFKSKDKIIGIMYIDTRDRVKVFTKNDLELLVAICAQLSVAIENTQLIEDLIKANVDLKSQHDQLLEATKFSALGLLASGVVHEIKNILQSIYMGSGATKDMLLKEDVAKEDVKECLENMTFVEDKVAQCSNIVGSLLGFARRSEESFVPTDLNKSFEAAWIIARLHTKTKKIKIENNLDPDIPLILADTNQLQQVFLNLIINAMDAMETGGILRGETSRAEEGMVEIRISDTGCGIPEDKLEEVFEPLYTSKGEGKGTGLGLSISKEIIDKHNGTIEVKSKVGVGTTFIMKFPVAEKL